VEARAKGPPYARAGPSYFLHGPNVLFDTPEESNLQLNRAGIGELAGCFYSHFHPDHTMGRRVFETRNVDWRGWPPKAKRQATTAVYLPEQQDHPILAAEATFKETLAIVAGLDAGRTVLSHIEEMDGLSHDDLREVARRHGDRFEFAHDGMVLDV